MFIETLARRGYRFIAPVNGASASVVVGAAPAEEQRQQSSFWTRGIAIACLSLMAIGVLVWAMWPSPWRRPEVTERKLTTNSSENSVNSAGISPDGKYLAYGDNTGVYLKLIRTGETHPVRLPLDFSARVDDWFPDGLSPDGSQRAIVVKGPDVETIQLRSTSAGKMRGLVVKGWKGLKNVDWSADGKSLVVSWGNHERDSALLRVTLDGKAVVLLRSNNYILYAIPSPDGKSLAIAEGSGTRNVWQIENF